MHEYPRLPGVLYRYENSEDKDAFVTAFKDDFDLRICQSDDQAIAEIQTNGRDLSAIVLDLECIDSPLPVLARALNPKIMSIQLHRHIALDSIVRLLESGLTDRCFAKPYDHNIVRSEINAAVLGVSSAPQAACASGSADQKYAVLIVDDEAVATKFLVKQLNRLACPCDILVADNAEQALELFKAERDRLAIIISDQRMPGIQGNQLLGEIQKYSPHVIRMLTSAYEEVDIALNAVNEGRISRYIKKPWNAEEINSVIKLSLAEFKLKLANSRQQQSNLQQQYQKIVTDRREALTQLLDLPISRYAGSGTLDFFFDCLLGINVLPANSASLRTSQQTDIESELVSGFSELFTNRLRRLLAQGQALEPGIDAVASFAEACATGPQSVQGILEALSKTDLGSELVACLKQLLEVSGLDVAALDLRNTDKGLVLRTRTGCELSLFRHILSAQTRIAQQMLQQQCSLLMLVVICRKLELAISIAGGEQKYGLSIVLSLRGKQGTGQRGRSV